MLFGLRPVSAQPVLDKIVAAAQVVVQKGCAILKVNFNVRIRYASHFPLERGDELRITLNPIDRNQSAALGLLPSRPEAVTVPDDKLAGIKAIELETRNPTGPVLRILFDQVATFKVAPGTDTRGIVVAIASKASATCQPIFPGPTVRPNGPAGTISDADLRAVAAWMDEGRAALGHRNLGGAIQLFTRILKYSENRYSAEARELLGLALQKGGQLGQAQAAYEDYLRRYPVGEESERVRQRLAAIITALGGPSPPLRQPEGSPAGMPPIGRFAKPRETIWTLVGSASTFYIRDDSFRSVRDPSVAPDPNADPDDHAVHQDEIFSTLDAAATWNNDQSKGRIRFSGGEEHRFDAPNQTDETGVSALSLDTLIKDWDLNMVMGRQTLNADGMLGRFDGMLLSWQALPMVKVDLVGGSPASSRYDLPLKNDRYFYGAGIHFGPFFGGLETSLYAIEQRDGWLLDREAIGADFRYVDLSKFSFGNVDYDIRFGRLNAAIFSGSWTLLDKSTLYGGADYRRTPYLSSWNALINQPFATLYDMLRFQTQDSQQVQQLAIDQTPIYKSAMLGFSHPLSDKLQVAADVTIVSLTQPIAPTAPNAALLATLPAGTEYYYSVQLIGNNIIKDGDMYRLAALLSAADLEGVRAGLQQQVPADQ